MPAAGQSEAAATASASAPPPAASVPRGQRAAQAVDACGHAAALRQAANAVIASTGRRPTHRLTGRPPIPGVVSPWPSIRKPTARQPSASSTRLPSRLRPATVAAATATASAQAEMAPTTTRWKTAERRK
jgi:hypothetical protein